MNGVGKTSSAPLSLSVCSPVSSRRAKERQLTLCVDESWLLNIN